MSEYKDVNAVIKSENPGTDKEYCYVEHRGKKYWDDWGCSDYVGKKFRVELNTNTMTFKPIHRLKGDKMNKIKESMEEYDNKIEVAIAEMLGVDSDRAKEISKKMPFEEYVQFTLAVESENKDEAVSIARRYAEHTSTPESIAQEMHYEIREGADYVIVPGFKLLGEMKQRQVLAEMTSSELQKILANVRGFVEPGLYETSLFDAHLVEDIIREMKNMKITQILELQALAPGEQNRAQAYGSTETPAKTTAPAGNKKPTATYMDQGEEKQGEVVNDDGINVTVKTDTGKTLRLPKDKVTVSENSEPINEDEFASSGKSAFIKRIKSQQEWKNGEYWQALMNVVYDDWQQPKLAEYGYAQFVEHVGSSYGDLAKLSLLLGKYNQQVTNGGHAQYTDNQYAGQYAGRNWNGEFSPFLHVELIDLFKKYNLSSLSHGGEVLSIMNDYLERIKDYNYDVEEWENQADPEDRAKADLERMGQPEPEPQEFETEEEYMDALSMWENEVSSLIDEYEEEEPHIMNYTGNLDKAYFAIYEDFTEDYNKWIGSKLKSQGFMGKIKGMFSRESTELDKIRRLAGLNESGMKRVIHKVMDELDAGIGEAQIARDLGISTNTVAEIKRDYYGPAQEQERSRIKGLWKQNEEVEENEEIARIKRLSGIK